MDIETETTLVSDSVDENEDEPKTLDNLKLELPVADSVVPDSLEVKHDSSSDCDVEPRERENNLKSKVKSVAESLDINDNSQMAMRESHGCNRKKEKAEERGTVSNLHAMQSSERDAQVTDQDNGSDASDTPSNQQNATELFKALHVPEGFLCSRIPRKVRKNVLFYVRACCMSNFCAL